MLSEVALIAAVCTVAGIIVGAIAVAVWFGTKWKDIW